MLKIPTFLYNKLIQQFMVRDGPRLFYKPNKSIDPPLFPQNKTTEYFVSLNPYNRCVTCRRRVHTHTYTQMNTFMLTCLLGSGIQSSYRLLIIVVGNVFHVYESMI